MVSAGNSEAASAARSRKQRRRLRLQRRLRRRQQQKATRRRARAAQKHVDALLDRLRVSVFVCVCLCVCVCWLRVSALCIFVGCARTSAERAAAKAVDADRFLLRASERGQPVPFLALYFAALPAAACCKARGNGGLDQFAATVATAAKVELEFGMELELRQSPA